ncbi:MAG: TonB family protein [Candidatus Latescibacteria bacterium]|nr:TonB family protein [Candidatus Latescibacterota bacterium]NIM21113.1 TonB family protein [Candidatus Latescibacterota bacterium]NIM65248.1 TonB family protein [Candidatus Latescibacterota bacterium]NIO01763.1 TonB family protein [Candidatus Latescibacterota bacterium]NIO28280.1 TonB family protein [Candidatus Latescibacterota bacterium]
MPITYGDKERAYRKRLLKVVPFAVVAIAVLFLSIDFVPPTVLDKTFGWRGALQVLPDITIIPGDDPFESFPRERKLLPMKSIHVDILEETGMSEAPLPKPTPEKKEEIPIPLEEDLSLVRTYPSHTDVPYSEDYVILEMVQPEYPINELLNGIEGEVTVELYVNEQGLVEKAWVLSAIGPRSFERSSLEAVEKFVFMPPKQSGLPMSMWIRFRIKFRIYG